MVLFPVQLNFGILNFALLLFVLFSLALFVFGRFRVSFKVFVSAFIGVNIDNLFVRIDLDCSFLFEFNRLCSVDMHVHSFNGIGRHHDAL